MKEEVREEERMGMERVDTRGIDKEMVEIIYGVSTHISL